MKKSNILFLLPLLMIGSCKKFNSNQEDAQLSVPPVISNAAGDEPMIGYATEAGGTTGGAGGSTVTVTNYAQLKAAVETNDSAKIVMVSGTITGTNPLYLKSNKTITSTNGATIHGVSLILANETTPVHNVIIRNIKIEDVQPDPGTTTGRDCITLKHGTHHVWVDHCDLSTPAEYDWESNEDFYDELMEATRGSDYITVSWTKFSNSWKGFLISGGNTETENIGKLHITMHHNYFYNILERSPLAGFGQIHVFNNYFRNNYVTGHIGYSIGAIDGSTLRIEKNYFDNTVTVGSGTNTSIPIGTSSANPGVLTGVSTNAFKNTVANQITTSPGSYTPSYSYSTYLTDTTTVPADVVAGAGTFTASTAPSITTQPVSQLISIGTGATLSVTATGSGLSYQWKKNGTNISGATSSSFTDANIQPADEGSYTVVVTNSGGSVTSSAAVITVNLLVNNGFENDLTSWTKAYGIAPLINTNLSHVHSGAKSLISGPLSGEGRGQYINSGFTVGATYTIATWGKVSAASAGAVEIEIQYFNSGGTRISKLMGANPNSTTFAQSSFSSTIPSGTTSILILVWNNGGTTFYSDDWSYTKN